MKQLFETHKHFKINTHNKMPLTRTEYCYMYFMWIVATCVFLWYLHVLITLPENNHNWFDREKGDL
jgi:hypothetical protein